MKKTITELMDEMLAEQRAHNAKLISEFDAQNARLLELLEETLKAEF